MLMKTWWVNEAGELTIIDHPLPSYQSGQALVKVKAFGLNRADIAQIKGVYPPPAGVTDILGLELAGEIVAVSDNAEFKCGDQVFGLVQGGAYAEYVTMELPLINKIPEGLTAVDAAALPEAWLTVLLNFHHLTQIQAGQRVLIHAGASGIGSTAITYAKSRQAYVIATSRSAHKLKFMQQLGADEVYLPTELMAESKRIQQQGGIDVILDPVGAETLALNQFLLNHEGILIIVSMLSGKNASLDLGQLLTKRQRILGSTLRNQPLTIRSNINQLFKQLIPLFIQGQLPIIIDKTFSYQDVPKALNYMAQNKNCGKIVITHT